jgi:hypothetical protein
MIHDSSAKIKAKELIDIFYKINGNIYLAKECALISLKELQKLCNIMQSYENAVFWKEVKKEIKKSCFTTHHQN